MKEEDLWRRERIPAILFCCLNILLANVHAITYKWTSIKGIESLQAGRVVEKNHS